MTAIASIQAFFTGVAQSAYHLISSLSSLFSFTSAAPAPVALPVSRAVKARSSLSTDAASLGAETTYPTSGRPARNSHSQSIFARHARRSGSKDPSGPARASAARKAAFAEAHAMAGTTAKVTAPFASVTTSNSGTIPGFGSGLQR